MENSSALQRLVNVLGADSSEIRDIRGRKAEDVSATDVLLLSMGFRQKEPYHVFEFYSLVCQALKEAQKLDKVRTKRHYAKLLEDITAFLTSPELYNLSWGSFQETILDKRILVSLDSLAESYANQFPKLVTLSKDDIDIFHEKFRELSKDITESDLSNELKKFLFESIERILSTLRRYKIDGTEGLQRIAKEFVGDWVVIEPKLSNKEARKPIVKKTLSWFGVLNSFLGVNLLSLMDVTPSYWPTIEKLLIVQEVIEAKSVSEALSLQEVLSEANNLLHMNDIKALEGIREPKALPPGDDKE